MSNDTTDLLIPRQREATTEEQDARDYCREMRQIADEVTADGPYIPRVAASEIVAKLRATDPDLLDGWLQAQAEHFVWQMINDRDRSVRAAIRHRKKPREFASAVKSHNNGDSAPLLKFMDMPLTIANGTRPVLGDLYRDDLLYVQGTYERRTRDNAMMGAFLGALAKKVGDGRVRDHFSEDQLAKMFDSLR